ncbi:MAG: (2Fe-2S)-binding protein [Gaiellales bacterium]
MKTILCLCHDVTEDDIARAVALGHCEPETIKRFTAAFMGPCQGRSCGRLVMAAIARHTGIDEQTLRTPAARPPAFPVRMGMLAGGPEVDA